MDTFDHAKHCTLCKQLDYLPLACSHCKNYYCSNHLHYIDHNCSYFESEQNRASANDIKIAMQLKKTSCGVKSCIEKKPFIQCKTCGITTCLHHRFPDTHNCSEQMKSNLRSPTSITSSLFEYLNIRRQKVSSDLEKSVENVKSNSNHSIKSQRELLNLPTPLYKRTGKFIIQKRGKLEPFTFVNKKDEPAMPVFKPNLLAEDQVFFDVFFPVDSQIQPIHFVIQKSWKIGRLVDALCSQGKITRSFDRNSSNQVYLYKISTGERLSNDVRIADLILTGTIENHDALILEKGGSDDNRLRVQTYAALWESCRQSTAFVRQHIERLQSEWEHEISVRG